MSHIVQIETKLHDPAAIAAACRLAARPARGPLPRIPKEVTRPHEQGAARSGQRGGPRGPY